ncbi:MAG: methyltransferase [Bacteroidetes bacterium]|nr:methyltransferase [Bacteroidota bacterium]
MSLSKKMFSTFAGVLSKKNIYMTRSLSGRYTPLSLPPNIDYVRSSTLELCYQEIGRKKLTGSVAELGVYKGDFAKKINALFADRKFYLFDTFKGFNNADIALDQQNNYSTGAQNFSNTSIELVKSKMPHPDQCVFKKGFFPDTANDVTDLFCFVSIDTDLYKPVYEGLLFFYPKLVPGGYIFIHDFNNKFYKGAKEAVTNFCNEQGISYVPIADNWGTAIITK